MQIIALFLILLISVLLALPGCEIIAKLPADDKTIEPSETIEETLDMTYIITDIIEDFPSEEATTTVEPEPESQEFPDIDLGFLIELDWPRAEADEGEIELKVFALPDHKKGIYSTALFGEVTFFDEQLKPIELPFLPLNWIAINYYDPKSNASRPIGYALKENSDFWEWDEETETGTYIPGDYILMLSDGTLPKDPEGEYIKLVWSTYDGYDSIIQNGSTVVMQGKDGLGIYDLKKQKEVLPCKYDSISPIDLVYYVVDDLQGFLYDKNGKELYSFGELTENELQYMEEFSTYSNDLYALNSNTIHRWFVGADYYMNIEEHIFYKISENESGIERGYVNGAIRSWGDYILYATDKFDHVYVTDRSGKVLYSGTCYNYQIVGDYLALYTTTGFVIVNKDFGERKFPVELKPSDMYATGPLLHDFNGDVVIYAKEFWDEELYSVDEEGNLLKVEKTEPEPVYQKDDCYYLQDADGNILLRVERKQSNGEIANLWLQGDFVILYILASDQAMSASQRAVYSLAGDLLIDGIFGITDSPAPGGGIFAYTTPSSCIVLYPDGSTVPVIGAPEVTKIVS